MIALIWLTFRVGFADNDVVALWPAAGLMLVLGFELGTRALPLIAISCLIYSSTFQLGWPAVLEQGPTLRFTAGALANGLGALAGASLYRRLGGRFPPFDTLRSTSLFLLAAAIMSLCAALVGTAGTIIDLGLPVTLFGPIVQRWFLSDLAGVILFAPLFLTWSGIRKADPRQLRRCLAIASVTFAAVAALTLSGPSSATTEFLLVIIVLPSIIVIAVQTDTVVALGTLSLMVAADQWLSLRGAGADEAVFLRVQVFELVTMCAALCLHSLNRERALALVSLARHRERLEQTVSRRTAELTQRNAELSLAKERADESARVKSQFLANMSHEIRTPMNGILGMTELALEGELTPRVRSDLEIVQRSAGSLLSILNDILDFSKVEAGKMEFEAIRFSPTASLGEALKTLSLKAYEKRLELLYDPAGDLPDWLIGDPGRLRQIVVNLVGNAIKFTETGEVGLRIERLENESDTRIWLRLTIFDSGIGIAEEQKARIFDAFRQADDSTTRKYGGTGLGLAISSQLVERMGGSLRLESTPGVGSRFFVELPFDPAEGVKPAPAADLLVGVEVAVVDDHADSRSIMARQLAAWGGRPRPFTSGRELLASLEARSEHNQAWPRVVILDRIMPDLDGFEVAERLATLGKNLEQTQQIDLVLLTSIGSSGDARRCRELGISCYLNKPVGSHELRDALLSLLGREPTGSADTPSTPEVVTRHLVREARSSPSPPPMRILVAEDNRINQKLARRLLEKHQHEVVIAEDGGQALQHWQEDEPYDLILMDMQMPVMGGIETTERIRAEEAKLGRTQIPIIALTANALRGDRERCLDAGMTEYLSKPIHPPELLAALARLAPRREAVESPPLAALQE